MYSIVECCEGYKGVVLYERLDLDEARGVAYEENSRRIDGVYIEIRDDSGNSIDY